MNEEKKENSNPLDKIRLLIDSRCKHNVHTERTRTIHGLKIEDCDPLRAGVVLVVKDKEIYKFGFGVDSKTGEITDFGGGRKHVDKDFVDCALRELKEETLESFKITKDELNDHSNSILLYNNNMAIIFFSLSLEKMIAGNDIFKNKIKTEKNPEVENIIWLTEDELKSTISGTNEKIKMYKVVRDFLQHVDISVLTKT